MYFKMNKRDELKAEIANTVFNILQNPKYSALAVGDEFKKEVLAEVAGHLNKYLDRSKEKNVDRILASVKDKLMKAPEFAFNHDPNTGDIHFTYHEPQEEPCNACPNVSKNDDKWGF
jgi:hypothetical protein